MKKIGDIANFIFGFSSNFSRIDRLQFVNWSPTER